MRTSKGKAAARTSAGTYRSKHPAKSKIIRKVVKKGVRQYAETFRRLANT